MNCRPFQNFKARVMIQTKMNPIEPNPWPRINTDFRFQTSACKLSISHKNFTKKYQGPDFEIELLNVVWEQWHVQLSVIAASWKWSHKDMTFFWDTEAFWKQFLVVYVWEVFESKSSCELFPFEHVSVCVFSGCHKKESHHGICHHDTVPQCVNSITAICPSLSLSSRTHTYTRTVKFCRCGVHHKICGSRHHLNQAE